MELSEATDDELKAEFRKRGMASTPEAVAKRLNRESQDQDVRFVCQAYLDLWRYNTETLPALLESQHKVGAAFVRGLQSR